MAGFTAAEIIQEELDRVSRSMRNPDAAIRQRGKFFYDIRRAWDVIASEHYPSLDLTLQGTTGPTTMTLSEPQARILDALAEAADVPHRKGQTVIDVPKQLRVYVRRLDQLFNNGIV